MLQILKTHFQNPEITIMTAEKIISAWACLTAVVQLLVYVSVG